MEKESVTVMSSVSFPVTTSGCVNWPVITHDPGGMGLEAPSGLTTVVAPAGAAPEYN